MKLVHIPIVLEDLSTTKTALISICRERSGTRTCRRIYIGRRHIFSSSRGMGSLRDVPTERLKGFDGIQLSY